ncbi:MAG: hypothetical protein ACKO5Q_28080, partial [Microcystaceae cyanobacterium]
EYPKKRDQASAQTKDFSKPPKYYTLARDYRFSAQGANLGNAGDPDTANCPQGIFEGGWWL